MRNCEVDVTEDSMTFEECCSECLKNKDLLKEFNRLSGLHLGEKRDGFQKLIDNACEYDPDKEAMPAFVDFVYSCIWSPLVQEGSNE